MGRIYNTRKSFKAKGPDTNRQNWHSQYNPYGARARKHARLLLRQYGPRSEEWGEYRSRHYVP